MGMAVFMKTAEEERREKGQESEQQPAGECRWGEANLAFLRILVSSF